jgi:hypothetical protein
MNISQGKMKGNWFLILVFLRAHAAISEHGIFQAPFRCQYLIQDGVIAGYNHAIYLHNMA